jgi:hypothetical protein
MELKVVQFSQMDRLEVLFGAAYWSIAASLFALNQHL